MTADNQVGHYSVTLSFLSWSNVCPAITGRGALCAVLVLISLCVSPVRGDAPRRVISLAPSVTEIVFALGAGDRLVGVSSYCDFPAAARDIDRVGTFLQPNIEVILAKRPDLVIAVPSPENRSAVEKLREFGLNVRVVRPEKIDEVLRAIEVIAADLELANAGERLVARIREDLATVESKVSALRKRRVLMIVGRRPLIAAGAGTYQDELIAKAGGINIAGDSGEAWPHLSLERVIVAAPEVIVDTGMGESEAAEGVAFWASFTTIPAVRDGRVVGAGQFDLLRPGPRVAATLETLARFIHPEAIAERSP